MIKKNICYLSFLEIKNVHLTPAAICTHKKRTNLGDTSKAFCFSELIVEPAQSTPFSCAKLLYFSCSCKFFRYFLSVFFHCFRKIDFYHVFFYFSVILTQLGVEFVILGLWCWIFFQTKEEKNSNKIKKSHTREKKSNERRKKSPILGYS